MAGSFAHGTVLSATISSVLTPIAGLTNIGGLDLSSDAIDVTDHDSDGYREFAQGLKDSGSVSLEGNFLNDASQAGLLALFKSGSVVAMTIEFPGALGTWSFDGFVEAFSTEAPMDDKAGFAASIKVSGEPTLTAGS
jgi:predicted secreted protein